MNGRNASGLVGVLVFPGTNSEEETVRACRAAGAYAETVHWNASLEEARRYDAYVLPGGFAYEDRVRAGAIAAHDRLMAVVCEGASEGKPVLGICNGAQILLESGLVPAIGGEVRPQAGFAKNAPLGKFRSTHVYVKLAIEPAHCAITAHLRPNAVIPAWASHGEGRLAAHEDVLEAIARDGHLAFIYCDANGEVTADSNPNGSALDAAALVNGNGNVLAIMPHAERDAWTFMHHDASRARARARARGDREAMLAPSGGIALFEGLAAALCHAERSSRSERSRSSDGASTPALRASAQRDKNRREALRSSDAQRDKNRSAALRSSDDMNFGPSVVRCVEVSLTIPDNEAETALATLRRLGLELGGLHRADLYRIELDAENADDALARLRTVETIFNPNKHRLELRSQAEPQAGETWIDEAGPQTTVFDESGPQTTVFDESGPQTTVFAGGQAVRGIKRIERFTAWRLVDAQNLPAPRETVMRANELLLCNAAFQRSLIGR
jgi:phosphoribosylformylglycinamidine synthase I